VACGKLCVGCGKPVEKWGLGCGKPVENLWKTHPTPVEISGLKNVGTIEMIGVERGERGLLFTRKYH